MSDLFLVKDIREGSASSGPTDLTVVGNTLFFSASNGTNRGLWKSDGTSSGTVLLKDNIEPGAYALPIYGYYGYYYSYYDYSSRGSFMTAAGNTLFFTARDETYETELWKSDGTSAGTVVVKDILPGAGSSYPGYLTAIGNTLYFSAYDGLERELWRSDGTANGTFLVKDINSGSGSSSPGELKAIGNTLYFRAFDDTNGTELWSSDGTSAGTRLIRDISPGENSSWPTYLTAVGASLFFTAYDGSHGEELWRSDGTLAGTAVVNILPGGNSSIPADLTAVHDILFFTAYDGTHGEELWISDGTASGTFLVRDINPGSTDSTPKPSNSPLYRDPIHRPIAVGNTFYFVANDGTHGFELWKSDGSSTGTSLVKDINPGIGSSSPRHLTAIGNTLYFVAYNTATGIELWKSDGSSAGTVLVQDIRPGASSSSPNELRSLGNTLLFTANDGTNGAELWGLTTEGALSNTPPSFTAIPDIEVIENATDTTIDLWPLFHDAEDPDSLLIYSVTSNSNSSLISADISATSGQLTLSFTPDQTGIAQITIEATDTDGASVSTDVTVLVTSFDANNDGIADSTQPTVISVATPNQQLATFVADSSISLPTIETVDSPDPDLAPAGLEFSQGFYDIRFDGLTPGDSTTLILYLPEASTINSYWKYGPLTPGGPSEWYDFGFDPVTQTGAEFQDLNGDGQNEILLHFVDGLRGDADLITNGTIVDPGGPAMDPTQEENQNNGEAIFSITTDGAPEVGVTLTASLESSDPDGDGAFAYQWQSSSDGTAWSDIAGATAQTYALTSADQGQQVRVEVAYTDAEGFNESVTAAPVSVDLVDDGDAAFSIIGIPEVGETLTATLFAPDPDGDPPVGYSYQWQSSSDGATWSDITGATVQTYALTSADQGQQIRVLVGYTDGEGFDEIVTAAPVSVGLVDDGDAAFSITGTPEVGETLTATLFAPDPDGDPPVGYSYQWQSSGDGITWADIAGATGQTYALTSADQGQQIRVLVAYTDGEGFDELVIAGPEGVGLVDDGDAAFSIIGIPEVGETLTATLDSSDPDGDGVFSYQWQSSSDGITWADIAGATDQTYALTSADQGQQVRVEVAYTDAEGFNESVTASPVSVDLVDDGDAAFSITGTPEVGETLTATLFVPDPDGDPPAGYSYQWQSSGDGITWADIAGATDQTYALTSADQGQQIRVLVAYTDGEGFNELVIAGPEGVPLANDGDAAFSITGTPEVGETLTATLFAPDPDGDPPVGYSYQWQSSSDGATWSDITGATDQTYALTSADQGQQVRVEVAYTDAEGFNESVTASPVSVDLVDDGDAAFSITGTPAVGETLTASLDSSDPDGDGVFSYQWQSSGDGTTWADIAGATGQTYALTSTEQGQQVRVEVAYTDAEGFNESVTAAPVSVDLVDDGDAAFSITGNPEVGETLTATLFAPDPDGDPPVGYSYQWQSSSDGTTWADITGATVQTYALTSADQDQQVRVLISYTDGDGFNESVIVPAISVSGDNGGDPVDTPAFSITPITGGTVVEPVDGTTLAVHLTVSLSEVPTNPVTVTYRTSSPASGTAATAGTDYEAISDGTLVFLPGATSQIITVTVNGDNLSEADEHFQVELFDADGATLPGAPAEVLIKDNGAVTIDYSSAATGQSFSGSTQGDTLLGSPFADTISGDPAGDGSGGPDRITGNGGPDLLIGGAAADLFRYPSLSDSTAAGFDTIIDFNPVSDGDRIALASLPSDLWNAGVIAGVIDPAAAAAASFADKDPSSGGLQALAANEAVLFSTEVPVRRRGVITHQFVAVNDGQPGFGAGEDLLIKLGGFTAPAGSDPLAVDDIFATLA